MRPIRGLLALCLSLTFLGAVLAAAAHASFGLNGLTVAATNPDGTVDQQAGSHPYAFTLSFDLNQNSEETPEGTLRNVVVDLPAGLVGNPVAVPRCSREDFIGLNPRCPGSTQVGVATVGVKGLGLARTGVFNLVPSPGVPASIGFQVANNNGFLEASLRTGTDYGVSISDISVPTNIEIQSVSTTIWGVPADASHNPERLCPDPNGGSPIEGCTTDAPRLPFLTLPTSCTGPLRTTVGIDSPQDPGQFVRESFDSVDGGGNPAGLTGCETLPFDPSITVAPETTAADSPTGLHVNVHVPQVADPALPATAHLRSTTLTLPAGLAVNPSAADGLQACSEAQVGFLGANAGRLEFTPGPVSCPEASKVGSVRIDTPLLDHPVPGAVYLARQGENPFGSLLALYIVAHDPATGVIVKLPGRVDPDPATGQLSAVFPENPQLPFEDFDADFFGGSRATLTTPSICGTYTAVAHLTPWSAPEGSDAFPVSSFQASSCAISEATKANHPSLRAGTATPIAGSYSPFVFKLSRENGSQQIGAVEATLPKGVTGKLAGIPYCADAQIAAAAARTNFGEGALEQAGPSCPPASEVGVVTVGAGSGSPFYVRGRAYLAGPYRGAPLSLAIITPAIAGPFDLGVVVVRTALYVDETTAQIRAVSDPLPTILAGIPLDVRSITLEMNRPNFTLNPTNCHTMAVLGSATSTVGQTASLSNRFQVGACGALGFKPSLALSLKGGTRRTQHPKLKAVVTYPKGSYANVARASVTLPRSEFIDPERVANPCTRPQFAEGKCPKDSILGTATAYTPLLDKPLTGKVYFRANGGERELPDIVADLNGQVHFVLVGTVDAVVKKGTDISRIRNTFATVPDAPVSKFVIELKGGKEGLLVNSENLCAKTRQAAVRLTAQNGRTHNTAPVIATSCPK